MSASMFATSLTASPAAAASPARATWETRPRRRRLAPFTFRELPEAADARILRVSAVRRATARTPTPTDDEARAAAMVTRCERGRRLVLWLSQRSCRGEKEAGAFDAARGALLSKNHVPRFFNPTTRTNYLTLSPPTLAVCPSYLGVSHFAFFFHPG